MDEAALADDGVARIAAAIGERARVRMLYCLMDNRARTSTELALVAEVSPSTASTHLGRLRSEGLVRVHVQGKHRYYSLEGPAVAAALEKLHILSGGPTSFKASAPNHLRAGRTCYDHLAGALGVALHDRLFALGWLERMADDHEGARDSHGPGRSGPRGARRRYRGGESKPAALCLCVPGLERAPLPHRWSIGRGSAEARSGPEMGCPGE